MNAGWRKFKCECGFEWEYPSRDCDSQSSESCPICLDVCFPVEKRREEGITDKHNNDKSNLIVPWNWNGKMSKCCNAFVVLDKRGEDLFHCYSCGNPCYF